MKKQLLTFALLAMLATNVTAGEIVVNGSFESGSFSSWQHGAFRGASTDPTLADHDVLLDLPFTGNYSALLGFKYTTQTTNAAGWMYQQVSIPTNISSATLYFKVRQQGYDSSPYDPFVMEIRDTGGGTLATVVTLSFTEYNDLFKDSGWLDDNDTPPVGYNMLAYAGQSLQLYFEQSSTIDALYETWSYVDDVSLVFTKFVDLAVDGNGDDVFGAVASGAGGLSARSALDVDTLSYALDVENEGLDTDQYQLSVTLPGPGWTVWAESGGVPQAFPFNTPSMAAGTATTYTIKVVPPGGVSAGMYDVIVDAVSTTFGNRFDSATLRADITSATFGTDLVIDGNGFGAVGDGGTGGFALKAAPWDSTVTYQLQVENTGTAGTTFDIDWNTPAGATIAVVEGVTSNSVPFTTASVAAGATLSLTLEMTVASPSQGGDYETIVRALASADTLMRDSVRAILRVRAPRLDVIIGSSGDDVYDTTSSGLGGSSGLAGDRGTQVIFPITIQNESSVADSFVIDWVPPAGGWLAVLEVGGVDQAFPFTTPTLSPFSQVQYLLKVTIPGGSPFGTFQSFLNAESIVDNRIGDSVAATISVSNASEVDVLIDGNGAGIFGPIGTGLGGSSNLGIAPGDSATFNVELQNLAGLDNHDVTWNTPPGWTVTFDGSATPVVGYAAGVYQLKVVVPVSEIGGSFDIIIDTQKTDKPFYMDSVLGRVSVVPSALVDGLIDGNGDDIIGAAGTGLGGSSTQLHSAPVMLNYTVELQNQGSLDDEYTVSWNTIPFWTATFAGSSTPFTTGTITVGASSLFTFSASVPSNMASGMYTFIIDIVSVADPSVEESLEAVVNIVGPPRADLVIDGNGLGLFGNLATGDGGRSTRGANPGTTYTGTLEVHNVGSFADSFQISWAQPEGWPAGAVTIDDGSTVRAAPFYTPLIGPGTSITSTVIVDVPAGLPAGLFDAIIDVVGFLPPNPVESVKLTTQTFAVVAGVVYDDRDHDLVFSSGDVGIADVQVDETTTGQTLQSGSAGRYEFWILGGQSATVIESNPAGFVSMTPDTIGPVALAAGDTLTADFGDVLPLRLSQGVVLNGIAGQFVDFPHRLDAGTIGQVSFSVTTQPGATTQVMFDENGNGVFDGNDRLLVPADVDMDPPGGLATVYVFVRVFVPLQTSIGSTIHVELQAQQTVGGTPVVVSALANDALLVIGSDIGRLSLEKSVDLDAAAPGDVLTYTISFFNAGIDSVQNIVILDPVSTHVDPMPDAFGPGQDVELNVAGAGPQYLTLNPADADECEYSATERLLKLLFSKNSAYFLEPGISGTLSYRVVVR